MSGAGLLLAGSGSVICNYTISAEMPLSPCSLSRITKGTGKKNQDKPQSVIIAQLFVLINQ